MNLIASHSNRIRRRLAPLVGIIACAALMSGARSRSVIAADEPSAADRLKSEGLQRIGRTWCLPEEVDLKDELKDELSGLDRSEQRLVAAQQSVDQLIGQNEACHQRLVQFEQLEKQSRELAAAAKPGTPQRAALDAQVKTAAAGADQFRRQYIHPDQLGLSAPLKPAMADLVNVRTDLMLRLLPMLESVDHLTQRYDSLRHDGQIKAALKSMTPPDTLGPMKSLRDGWKIVDKLQPMVFSDAVPVCRESHFYRVTAIVNERQPLTFSFMGTGQQTLIPQNLAEAAGLTIDANARKIKLRLGGGREEMAWQTKVPQLRFGRHVLHDVEAYILAPEAADLGARIGAQAFAGYHVQLDADHLLLVVGGGK